MSATWRLLPRIDAMMFCPEPLVKRAWTLLEQQTRARACKALILLGVAGGFRKM
jgi:hypothetical protein